MRVAFWWKLNWSWFCVIQCYYDEARKPINKAEIEPFPDKDTIRILGSESEIESDVDLSVLKTEVTLNLPSSDNEMTQERMEDVVVQLNLPEHLHGYWKMAKRRNMKP